MTDLWIDDRLYLVDTEVQDYVEKLETENKWLKKVLEVIDTIARNTTKLTSPLYPATIKMIRQKIKQALKG